MHKYKDVLIENTFNPDIFLVLAMKTLTIEGNHGLPELSLPLVNEHCSDLVLGRVDLWALQQTLFITGYYSVFLRVITWLSGLNMANKAFVFFSSGPVDASGSVGVLSVSDAHAALAKVH